MEETNKCNFFKELKLKKNFIKNTKLLHVFKVSSNKVNIIITTNDDKTFVFGHNSCGVLGFGHSIEVKNLTLNEDLSKKNFIDFKNSNSSTIARTVDGKVYCWGQNVWGLLGNGNSHWEIGRPVLNQHLSDKNIIDICSGAYHSLVLTSGGQVYAWGWNYYGQVGNGSDDFVSIPFHVKGFNGEKVKAIACGFRHSMALTEKGNVFSWGENHFGQPGFKKLKDFDIRNVPKLININEIFEKISCGSEHSLLLSRDGEIYVFGSSDCRPLGGEQVKEQNKTALKLKNENKFIDIASHFHYNISMALSEEGTIFILGECGSDVIKTLNETQFKSFDEVFAYYEQITYKTICVRNKLNVRRNRRNTLRNLWARLTNQEISVSLRPEPTISLNSDETNETRYKREFKELEIIGSGTFGKVFKVLNLFDEQIYAVKKILLSGLPNELKERYLKEFKLMAKLQSDHVVQYKSSWIENNEILYIQMELCFNTLKNILLKKTNEFQRQRFKFMSRLEYYISSELFKEIVESLNYLHKQTPPIIHRDLKPANILITYGLDGRFVKLADFGLAVVHKFDEQTHTQGSGTIKYIAPEVLHGKNYDTKADIYSLGSVSLEIFDIDVNSSSTNAITDQLLKGKYMKIEEIVLKMMEQQKIKRPECDQILKDKTLWGLDINELEIDISRLSLTKQSIEENFHNFFIKTKLKFRG